MSAPSVSVTVLQWGKTDLTVRAVDSVRRSRYDGEIEILVWDNGSEGGPGPIAERDDVRLFVNDTNIGFGPGHNRLAAEATGDLLLILNNDVVLDRDCIARLADAMDDRRAPGAVGPQYRAFDGGMLESGGFIGSTGDGWQLFKGEQPPGSFLAVRSEAHYSSATCLMLRRSEFLELGGFDDLFAPAYYEDTDLCFKLREAGRPILIEPRAVCFHYEGATGGKDVSTGFKAYQVRNRSRFLERWAPRLAEMGEPASFSFALAERLRGASGGRLVLWLSPHLPRVDREAGHLRIIRMIEHLRAAGDVVAMWIQHPFDVDRYGTLLDEMGVLWMGGPEVRRWRLPGGTRRVLESLEDVLGSVPWDTVVVSFPDLAQAAIPVIRRIRPEAGVVIDSPDLHFLREERGSALGVAPGAIGKAAELQAYLMSDGVVTASDVETEVLAREIPSVLATAFPVAAEEPVITERGPGRFAMFLGNFAHAPNLDGITWWFDEIQPAVRAAIGEDFVVRVVGSGSDAFASRWEDRADVAGWIPDLAAEFAETRVFVVPLRFGAGTKGKITVALAHGVPIVTTPVGAEGFDETILGALRVADSAAEFAAIVAELMTDDAAWDEQRRITVEAARAAWERQRHQGASFAGWVRRRTPLDLDAERRSEARS